MQISFLFSWAPKTYPGWSDDLHLMALVGDGRSLRNELGCEALEEGSCLEAKDFASQTTFVLLRQPLVAYPPPQQKARRGKPNDPKGSFQVHPPALLG